MSKAKSSVKATVEVVNASEVSVEAVASAKKAATGLAKGAKAEMVAKLVNAVNEGRLTFERTEDPKTMIATTQSGWKYTLTLHEEQSERAKVAGETRFARVVGVKTVDGVVAVRSPILNGKELWKHYNPDYKFPSISGKAKVDPNKQPRERKPKAPAVVHNIDDLI